jgi:hypothetical protein
MNKKNILIIIWLSLIFPFYILYSEVFYIISWIIDNNFSLVWYECCSKSCVECDIYEFFNLSFNYLLLGFILILFFTSNLILYILYSLYLYIKKSLKK